MNVIAVTGIDGSGKSSVLKAIANRRIEGNTTLTLESLATLAGFSYSAVAKELLTLDREADLIGDPVVKSNITLLLYALQGRAIAHLNRKQFTQIVMERHALIDLIVYGKIYLRTIADGMNRGSSKKSDLVSSPGLDAWACELSGSPCSVADIHRKILPDFEGDDLLVLKRLSKRCQLSLPDKLFILVLDPQAIEDRLRAKSGQKSAEYHENLPHLIALQQAYLDLSTVILSSSQRSRVTTINTSAMDIETCADRILES